MESEVLRMVDHPNVIKIFGIFEDNDKIYTVLEYCSAGDFFEFIANNCKNNYFKILAPFQFQTAQFFTAKIIKTLEHIHNLGIIHRDIKPDNILIDEKMNIKIVKNV